MGLVDPDEIALGEPELDLGNLIAHFDLIELQAGGGALTASAAAGRLIDAYAELGAVSKDRLVQYRAAALLRLASLERLAEAHRSGLPREPLAAGLLRRVRRFPA